MGTLTFKKRVTRKKGAEETVFLNCSSFAREQEALLRLWHVGRIQLTPGGEHTYTLPKERKSAMAHLEFASGETKSLIEHLIEREEGKKIPARPFAVIFKKGRTWDYKVRNDTGRTVSQYYLAVEESREMEQFFHLGGEGEILYCPEEERPYRLMEEIFRMAENASSHTAMDLSLKLFEFLSVLSAAPREIPPGRRKDSTLMEHVSKFPQNYSTIRSLMELFQVSETTLYTIFRRETGKSPMEFVIRCRLDNSCWQLAQTNTPVGEIAKLNGYGSVSFYSRAFKREFGISPARYRQNALLALPLPAGRKLSTES